MDKTQKMKVAKILVMLDDSIGSSGGLADFIGKMMVNALSVFVGADMEKSDKGSVGTDISEE